MLTEADKDKRNKNFMHKIVNRYGYIIYIVNNIII